ncbi:MAG: hypothetical protein DRO98_07110 [Archaeoglobales archaeon]|nr:MAG: hypothetical protein DRO98_07110 [Archaeoglobales archaeon]
MARDYMRRARRCLMDAENAFNDSDYPMTVRSQECVEMSLKAVLRAFGIDIRKSTTSAML